LLGCLFKSHLPLHEQRAYTQPSKIRDVSSRNSVTILVRKFVNVSSLLYNFEELLDLSE